MSRQQFSFAELQPVWEDGPVKFYKLLPDRNPLRVEFRKTKTSPIGDKCKRCWGTGIEPNQAAIGAELKKLRLAAHISLRRMAQRLHISHGFLHQLEAGRRRWNPVLEEWFIRETEKRTPKGHPV
jgi:DNA-binding XRE family transcriptional regulator